MKYINASPLEKNNRRKKAVKAVSPRICWTPSGRKQNSLSKVSREAFPMQTEAVTAGFYESKTWGKQYPKVQLLTIAELLAGKKIDMPPIKQVGATFKRAERFNKDNSVQYALPDKKGDS